MNKRLLYVAAAIAVAFAGSPAGAQGLGLQAAPALQSAGLAAPAESVDPALGGDSIAAVVGNEVITEYDVTLRMRAALQQIAQQGGQAPAPAQLHAQLLEQMIDQTAMAQYAQDSGIDVNADTVTRAVTQMASGYKLDVDQFRRQIEAEGMGWEAYRTQIKREILIGRLRQRDVASRVQVSDQDIDDYLATQQRTASGGQERLDLAQIFVAVPAQAAQADQDAARRRIDNALAKLKAGQDFADVATLSSDGPEAKVGGELGARASGDWPGLFLDAVRGLQPGQYSAVIRSPAGFHIVKLVSDQSGDAGSAPKAMQSQVAEIVLNADDNKARDAAVTELSGIRDAVEQGTVQFGEKARELSQDIASANRGGDAGWVLPGELPGPLDAALNRLNPGQVSDPIALPDRVVLLQLVDRREQTLTKDQERAVARNVLSQQKEAKAFEDLVKDVRSRTYVRLPDQDS
jgi:peptidyl-prolyl cis-trans isomerase SurA